MFQAQGPRYSKELSVASNDLGLFNPGLHATQP